MIFSPIAAPQAAPKSAASWISVEVFAPRRLAIYAPANSPATQSAANMTRNPSGRWPRSFSILPRITHAPMIAMISSTKFPTRFSAKIATDSIIRLLVLFNLIKPLVDAGRLVANLFASDGCLLDWRGIRILRIRSSFRNGKIWSESRVPLGPTPLPSPTLADELNAIPKLRNRRDKDGEKVAHNQKLPLNSAANARPEPPHNSPTV